MFQFYHQAKYINEIAAAGKAEFPIPCYINVWIDYPRGGAPQRQLEMPGIALPQWRGGAEAGGTVAGDGAFDRHDRPGHLRR